ncbi:hypothetical protein BDK51DRAFT_52297 [Blyttiomyces helicus]|uniref:Uncharacterized protein n=1 Tax=Blyttiomyces helicus TaxID=388810 RepID=A0A4P9WF47_9FUNG|nr:hypothetical protein BDK51DRAFT_52297 [Blyttiomyces helicus]|eukprot:RKO91351.1 hypothetical protein BDK51DRAFT_52297 [Blyttiomyces helicus]
MKFGWTVMGNLPSTQSNSDETSVNLHPHPPRGFVTKIAKPNRTTTIAAHAAFAAKAKTEARSATHRDIELAKIKLAQTRLESDAKIRAAELESNAKIRAVELESNAKVLESNAKVLVAELESDAKIRSSRAAEVVALAGRRKEALKVKKARIEADVFLQRRR